MIVLPVLIDLTPGARTPEVRVGAVVGARVDL
jgi:hypothetical protein